MSENVCMPILSVEKTISQLSNMYSQVVYKGLSPKVLPSVMLWGPPGVGKSQAIRQIAKEIQKNTGKETRITDVRLLLFNPIDLRGIPTANADKTLAIWLKPQIFQMDPREDLINILFLDEISAAPQSVQAAAYQITLDRVVGEHKLPDNCIVIAAGNRVTDKSVSFKMPKALANRLLHIEVEGSFSSWEQWAIRAGIHPKVLGFLSFNANHLFGFDSKVDDLAFATPRSWEMVSNLLNNVNEDEEEIFSLISGLIGRATAYEFRSWCKNYYQLPNVQRIFEGKCEPVPKEVDAIYSIVTSMCRYAKENKNNVEQIANSLEYAMQLPADFASLLLERYEAIEEGYCKILMQIPSYMDLAKKYGGDRNGKIR